MHKGSGTARRHNDKFKTNRMARRSRQSLLCGHQSQNNVIQKEMCFEGLDETMVEIIGKIVVILRPGSQVN